MMLSKDLEELDGIFWPLNQHLALSLSIPFANTSNSYGRVRGCQTRCIQGQHSAMLAPAAANERRGRRPPQHHDCEVIHGVQNCKDMYFLVRAPRKTPSMQLSLPHPSFDACPCICCFRFDVFISFPNQMLHNSPVAFHDSTCLFVADRIGPDWDGDDSCGDCNLLSSFGCSVCVRAPFFRIHFLSLFHTCKNTSTSHCCSNHSITITRSRHQTPSALGPCFQAHPTSQESESCCPLECFCKSSTSDTYVNAICEDEPPLLFSNCLECSKDPAFARASPS